MSDVLIRGMEMPKPGQIVLVEIDENGDVFAAYDGGRTKLVQYKAVPVPPHGDLIDRDLFIEFIKTHYDQWFVEQLEARPTIIEAEEGE